MVAEAIGYTVHLVSASQLDTQLPRLIPTIQQLYKKHQEHYYLSQVSSHSLPCSVYYYASWFVCYMQCLCMVVDAACKKNCETFQTLLDNLLLMLHTYVSGCDYHLLLCECVCYECRHVLQSMSTTLLLSRITMNY